MKRFLLSIGLLASISQAALAGNWFGAGPWSSDAFYPGYLNGKYQASVTGLNIIGVVGFSIVDGAPPSRETESQEANAGGPVLRNVNLGVDPFQNYFLIFHEGRAYKGETIGMIDLSANTVTGSLRGTDPAGVQPFTAVAGVNAVVNALPVVNRGLSGGFLANIDEKNAVLSFSGTGQLSSAANAQTVSLLAIPAEYDPADVPPSPTGTITNEFIAGQVATTSTPFSIRGLRTSYAASNAVSSASLIGQ
jgi:hypothetical protein